MSSFENLRVVDNFYQTSLFFPMPTVVISTLCEEGAMLCADHCPWVPGGHTRTPAHAASAASCVTHG